jgi:hypothetical protein
MSDVGFRIVVIGPPTSVTFRLQKGRGELVPPAREFPEALEFELTLRVGEPLPGGAPRFLGPFAQGPPDARFVYVCSGTLAGQADSCWTRRAKVPLASIPSSLVRGAIRSQGTLEATIAGTGRDGGPCCGTVPLEGGSWRLAGGTPTKPAAPPRSRR